GPSSAGTSTHHEVFFRQSDQDFDSFLEVTVKVTISEAGSGGTWSDNDYWTTLLVRAMFPRPRLRFTRRDQSGNFVPVDDTAVLPGIVVDDAGTVVAPDPRSQVFLELRCHDVGATVTASAFAGGASADVTLNR